MKLNFRCFVSLVFAVCIYGGFVYRYCMRTNGNTWRLCNFSTDKNSQVIVKEGNAHALLNFRFPNISKNWLSSLDRKTITFFNVPGFSKFKMMLKLSEDCEYKNCLFTRNKSKLSEADAVMFYIGRIFTERMGIFPPLNMSTRNPNQIWIFMSNEPPENFRQTDYQLKSWENTMNWSIHYTLDSDIPNPYGALVVKRERQHKDYMAIYKMKTRNALWVVSHNKTFSAREKYVDEMIRHGFDVDIKGLYGTDKETITSKTLRKIIPSYKFYLGFENALCTDYITEKYFKYYNFDWIVVVRGGAQYHRLLPAQTFISTSDFQNISSLVVYLTNLGKDKDRYIEHLRYKDRFTSITRPAKIHCEICKRLNNLSKFRKTYQKMADVLSKDQCVVPTDTPIGNDI